MGVSHLDCDAPRALNCIYIRFNLVYVKRIYVCEHRAVIDACGIPVGRVALLLYSILIVVNYCTLISFRGHLAMYLLSITISIQVSNQTLLKMY